MKRLCLLLVLVTSPLGAQVTPRDIAANARPAVVRVTALADGQELAQGSGFFVSTDGMLVTNHHVVEDADHLRVELASGERYDRVYLVSSDPRRDIVILRVPATHTPVLHIADDQALQVGDPVYVMGNPMGLDGTFSDGLLSARRTVDGIVLLQISAPISPGSSGGPVFNAAGQVVGVATLTLRDAQNLNLAVPARYADGLLAMHDTPRPFTEVADQFASTGQARPEDASGQAGADEDELDPWARVLLSEVRMVDSVATEIGYVQSHDPYTDELDEGDSNTVTLDFTTTGRYLIAGVCDIDCTDLDLDILDVTGEVAVQDVEPDSRPTLVVDVMHTGTYKVHVYMVSCGVEPCVYTLQAYREKN
ncbi:MAG: S1C family serine protease [Gemmatimonadota bacterium]|jgi:hypothetical protein